MSEAEFRTQRLIIRRLRDSDIDALLAVYGDAEAMRWVGDGRAITREECVRWLEVTRTNYQKRGYGMLAIEQASSPGVVGFCGIVHPGGQAEPEIKYAILRSCWGRGFATEAISALISYAHKVHKLAVLIATTAPANSASHNVLLKVGMQRAALRTEPDGNCTQLFQWHADDNTV